MITLLLILFILAVFGVFASLVVAAAPIVVDAIVLLAIIGLCSVLFKKKKE